MVVIVLRVVDALINKVIRSKVVGWESELGWWLSDSLDKVLDFFDHGKVVVVVDAGADAG